MSKLDELLRDKSKFKDDLQITVGEEKYSLGDLRAVNDALGGELSQRIKQEQERIAADRQELEQGRAQLITAFDSLQRTARPEPARQSPGDDWENDPFYEPVKKTRSEIRAELDQQKQSLAQIQKALALGVKYIGDSRARDQFRQIKASAPKDWQNDLKFEDLHQLAVNERLVDEGGFPDLEKAYSKWSSPRELDRIRKESYEKGKQDGSVSHAEGLPRPGSGFQPPNPSPKWNSAREMSEQMVQDPDVMAEINALIGQA